MRPHELWSDTLSVKRKACETSMNYSLVKGLLGVGLFWLVVSMLDKYLKLYHSERYEAWLKWNGVSVEKVRINWFTERFNNSFLKIGDWKSNFWKKWFNVGVYVNLVCCIISLYVLISIPIKLFTSTSEQSNEQVLQPVIPGVNLPLTQLGYFIFTMFTSAFLHECGHAVSAVSEGVTLNGMGMFLFCLYPGAYVDINTQSLLAVSTWRQLKIFSAGIWHNVVICMISALLLISLPYTLPVCGYSVHEHVAVVEHTDSSVLTGERGLLPGDVLLSLDECKLISTFTWRQCIIESIQNYTHTGNCVHKNMLESDKQHLVQLNTESCDCSESQSDICFTSSSSETNINNLQHDQMWCLNARQVKSYPYCNSTRMCAESTVECVYPLLDNNSRLISIHRQNGLDVIFLGHPAELYQSVIIGDVVPSQSYLPFSLPYILQKLLKYFLSLSGALAMLNVIPCYLLDGQYLCQLTLDLLLPQVSAEDKDVYKFLVLSFGTLLLILNVLIGFYNVLL